MGRRVQRCLLGGMLAGLLFWGAGTPCDAQSNSAADSQTEKLVQFLQEAQADFDNQEFRAGFELYQRVLLLDPGNQVAREKISTLAEMYKTLEDIARKEQDAEKADLLNQQHREVTRYLLKILTSQLESSIQTYRALKTSENEGRQVKESIVPVLENIITVLTELKELYKDVSEDEERTKHMTERISNTLENYENEFEHYSELK